MKVFNYRDLELILAHNENGLYSGANLCYNIRDKTDKICYSQAIWIQDIKDLERVREFFAQDNIRIINVRQNLSCTRFAGYLVKLGV